MYDPNLFPSTNPQRDHDRARSRAVTARKRIAECESILATGCDVSGDARARLQEARGMLAGAQREMQAMVRQGARAGSRKTPAEWLEELRGLKGEKPRDKSPVYLDKPVRKAARALGYMTKYLRAEDS
jgi:hypothetical protein